MPNTIFVKNMVCQRCVMTVERILHDLEIPFLQVKLGEIEPGKNLTAPEIKELDKKLNEVGFELIDTRINKVIENIKLLIIEYINAGPVLNRKKLSTYITDTIPNDYSYLSDLFSSVEGQTIEQFYLNARIEKVKELIVYDQLSLTEIAFQTGFSSVHHLSSQFKKLTGLTPSHFRKVGLEKRKTTGK